MRYLQRTMYMTYIVCVHIALEFGRPYNKVPCSLPPPSVQYDGKRVVSGAYDYLVKVWNIVDGACLHTLQGHTNRVYSLQVRQYTEWVCPLWDKLVLAFPYTACILHVLVYEVHYCTVHVHSCYSCSLMVYT